MALEPMWFENSGEMILPVRSGSDLVGYIFFTWGWLISLFCRAFFALSFCSIELRNQKTKYWTQNIAEEIPYDNICWGIPWYFLKNSFYFKKYISFNFKKNENYSCFHSLFKMVLRFRFPFYVILSYIVA